MRYRKSILNKLTRVGLLLAILFFASCEKQEMPMTCFFVKNTSHKAITFDATVIKHSQQSGTHEVLATFTVFPNDSVLAREVRFVKDGKNPQNWFKSFVIYPEEGITMNDPNLSENWIKYYVDDLPIYVFTLNKTDK